MFPRIRSIGTLGGTALLSLLALSLPAATARAAKLLHGKRVAVAATDTVHDDVYAFGGTVDIAGTIDGDVVATGGQVNVTGTVHGSVLATGGEVRISGDVTGSVRAAGGRVTLASAVGHDLVVAGGRVYVDGANVARDAMIAGGRAFIEGRIGRTLRAAAGELVLGDRAFIGGNLDYASDHPLSRTPAATVNGKISWHDTSPGVGRRLLHAVRWVIGLLLLGLLLMLLAPRVARRSTETLGRRPLASFGIGVLTIAVVAFAAMTLTIFGLFVGGWWLGMALLGILCVMVALGVVVAAIALGSWLGRRAGVGVGAQAVPLLIGLVVLVVVAQVPLLGRLVKVVAMLCGLGALASVMLAAIQAARRPEPAAPPA